MIKNLHIRLEAYHGKSLLIYVVVVDVPDAWGILLSRKCIATLGVNIQMGCSYARIPTTDNGNIKFHVEKIRRYHEEDLNLPMN
jgi:hypothetical protein